MPIFVNVMLPMHIFLLPKFLYDQTEDYYRKRVDN